MALGCCLRDKTQPRIPNARLYICSTSVIQIYVYLRGVITGVSRASVCCTVRNTRCKCYGLLRNWFMCSRSQLGDRGWRCCSSGAYSRIPDAGFSSSSVPFVYALIISWTLREEVYAYVAIYELIFIDVMCTRCRCIECIKLHQRSHAREPLASITRCWNRASLLYLTGGWKCHSVIKLKCTSICQTPWGDINVISVAVFT